MHQVKLELTEKEVQVSKLKSKYEILSTKNDSLFDDKDAPKTQGYYLIRAAQEREELKKEGNALDVQIEITQKEVLIDF